MKFEIKHRFSGEVLFALECGSIKICAEVAIRQGVNLRGADLSGANLRGADLSGANLSGANLSGAYLNGAYLSGANLSGANLSGANLSGAYLNGANLTGAYLRGADLTGSDLRSSDKYYTTPLYMLYDQPGKIRAYKLVNSKNEGPYQGGIVYEQGKTYAVDYFCADEKQSCGAGINLATLDWCLREYRKGYKILIAEFTAKDIVCVPIGSDGKFRVKRCKIVGEKNPPEPGLV